MEPYPIFVCLRFFFFFFFFFFFLSDASERGGGGVPNSSVVWDFGDVLDRDGSDSSMASLGGSVSLSDEGSDPHSNDENVNTLVASLLGRGGRSAVKPAAASAATATTTTTTTAAKARPKRRQRRRPAKKKVKPSKVRRGRTC